MRPRLSPRLPLSREGMIPSAAADPATYVTRTAIQQHDVPAGALISCASGEAACAGGIHAADALKPGTQWRAYDGCRVALPGFRRGAL